jgi:hypothetical protein
MSYAIAARRPLFITFHFSLLAAQAAMAGLLMGPSGWHRWRDNNSNMPELQGTIHVTAASGLEYEVRGQGGRMND